MEQNTHHVHFQEASDGLKNNDIVVKPKGDRKLEIQLGFLQVHHVYEISIRIPKAGFTEDLSDDYKQVDDPVPNINCRIAEIEVAEDTVDMLIKFKAVKEKLVREKIKLKSGHNELSFEFIARVLGKGKGTPMLRSGIKCVHVQPDPEETEASDWQGFD